MINNTNPLVTVSSYQDTKSLYSVVPNFLWIDKPTTKVVGKKTVKTKKLIIWFDIRSERESNVNWEKIPPEINLNDFNWQLLSRNKGDFELLKPVNSKEEVAMFKTLKIRHDFETIDINPKNTLVYELDAEQFKDEVDLQYKLSYHNDQNIGLTTNGVSGNNAGHIVIKPSKDQFVFNNAFAYLENNEEKVSVLDKEIVAVKKRHLYALDDVSKPLVEISSKSVVKSEPSIALSEQIRAELARLQVDRINYLDSAQNDLKIVKNNNAYEIYQAIGNHYDFQTNKYKTSKNLSYVFQEKSSFEIEFEYNNRNLSVSVPINDVPVVIKNLKHKQKRLDHYISYANVKPNTKFEAFIGEREFKLWK